MRVGLDTNILAYAEGTNGIPMRERTLELIQEVRSRETVVLPGQTLAELFHVLVRKAGRSRADARAAVLAWLDAVPVIETSRSVILAALDLATDHQLSIWDAVILAAAAEAGCRLLLSEDLQDGFTWGGVTVVNPFAAPVHPLLAALLTDTGRP